MTSRSRGEAAFSLKYQALLRKTRRPNQKLTRRAVTLPSKFGKIILLKKAVKSPQNDTNIISKECFVIEPEIKKLVERAIRGDENAFTELCRKKSRDILYHVSKLIANKESAEDTAQEVVISMYRDIHNLKQPEAFYAWMYRVIANRCFRTLSKTNSERRMRQSDIIQIDDLLTEERVEFLPYEYLQREDIKSRLIAIIEKLPRKRRSAVIMYYYNDLSYAEIAYALDVSISTVSTNLMKARDAIKKELEIQMGDVIDFKKDVGSAAPLIVQALNDDVTSSISAATLDNFQKRWADALILKKQAASAGAAHSASAATSTKMIACIVAGALTVTCGVLAATGLFHPGSTPITATAENLAGGELVFLGGDCDCGHVNPDNIRAEGVKVVSGDEIWRIVAHAGEPENSASAGDDSGTESSASAEPAGETASAGDDSRTESSASAEPADETVYSGNGADIPALLAYLYNTRADGAYTAFYERTDEQGNTIRINREFCIDTGKAGIVRTRQ
jgi:RNA polymerase sigma-70 factor (ECF subfamily)